MTIYTVADILTCVFESIMIFMLLETFFTRKEIFPNWVYVLGTGVLTILIILSNHTFNFGSFNAVCMSLSIFGISFLYDGLIRTKIIISTLSILFMAIIEVMVMFTVTSIYGITAAEAIENPSLRLLGIIVSKMLTFAVINVIRVKLKQREFQIGKTYWILFFLIFISSHIAVFLIFKLSYNLESTYMNSLSIICSFGLLFNTLFSFYLYEHLARQTKIINCQQRFEQHLNSHMKHLDEILVTQNQVKKFKHDFSNHIIALKGYFDSNDCMKGLEYINKLNSMVKCGNEVIETGNTALDAILSTKKAMAESKSIIFVTQIQVPENIGVDAVDLCVIFGNALDNAIEACEKVPVEDRKISLTIICKGNSIFCKIVNAAPEAKKGALKTSKNDKNNHGFGIENIKLALEKYNSEPTINYNGTEFILKFVIFTKE